MEILMADWIHFHSSTAIMWRAVNTLCSIPSQSVTHMCQTHFWIHFMHTHTLNVYFVHFCIQCIPSNSVLIKTRRKILNINSLYSKNVAQHYWSLIFIISSFAASGVCRLLWLSQILCNTLPAARYISMSGEWKSELIGIKGLQRWLRVKISRLAKGSNHSDWFIHDQRSQTAWVSEISNEHYQFAAKVVHEIHTHFDCQAGEG